MPATGRFRPRAGTAALACLLLSLCAASVQAQSVALTGMFGPKALLVIDGGDPKAVGPGEAHRGVKVLATRADAADVEIAGQRQTLRLGGAPVSVGKQAPPGAGTRIVLPASSDGHFVTQGMLNSRPAQFMIDTGATTISLGAAEADRLGLQYKNGEAVGVATANGVARGWKFKVASVRLNDVEVREVDAVVMPMPMPFILLGNSFLARFQMTRNNDQMVLEKRP